MQTPPAVSSDGLLTQIQSDSLHLYVYESRQGALQAAAQAVAAEMRRLIATQGRASGIFTALPSQREFLSALASAEGINWTRVIGFHLAEYWGVEEEAPQSLRRVLLEQLVKRVPIVEFHGLRGEASNARAVCANYAKLLQSRPPDFATLELSPNGRLGTLSSILDAVHDQPAVKLIELDAAFRQQQLQTGAAATLSEIPQRALSLTLSTVMNCPRLFVTTDAQIRPGALRDLLSGAASLLCTHPDAHLFLDRSLIGV